MLKTRGPYKGWLDLPGGRMESGESFDSALARELGEEVGASVITRGAWHRFSLQVTTDSQGASIDFLHEGLIAEVSVQEPINLDQPKQGEDVAAALWVSKAKLLNQSNLSAPLRHALIKLASHNSNITRVTT